MESRTPSPRTITTTTIAIASAVAVAIALAVGVYVSGQTQADPQALPASAKASASASSAAAAAAASPAHSGASAAARQVASSSPSTPSEPVATRSKEQAAAALMALPELQTWSALVEKNSGGKSHGALIEYDPAPRKLNGKNYWQFSFVENSAEAALRWESFLVSSCDDEILVEDASTDEVISLARWRREKHPAKRTGVDG